MPATRRFGARPFGMLVAAYVWVLLGVGAFREISTFRSGAFHLLIPGEARGWAWIVSAAIAVCFAWSRRYSPIGIGILLLMPGMQMVSFGLSWILAVVPGGSPGYGDGWYSSAYSLAMVFLVVLIALIPSPPSPAARPTEVTR